MPENGKISVRQLTVLMILITIGDSILVLAPIIASYAKQDAWISGLIGLTAGLIIVYIIGSTGRLYPQLTLIQSIMKIMGKWAGTCIAVLFLIYFLITTAAFVREIGDFFTAEMMPETPIQAIQILFIGIVVMAGRLGLEVIVRSGELFFPIILFLLLLLILFLCPQVDFNNLHPVLETGIKPALHGSITFITFPFAENVVILMILPSVNKPLESRKKMIQGALTGGIILVILITISILVLGEAQTSRSVYPSYSLARRVSISHFIERIEAMLAFMWLLTIFIKTSLYFFVLNSGIAQLLNMKDYRALNLPMGMLVIVLASVLAPNITYYNTVVSRYWPYFDATYGLLLPLLLIAVYYIRSKIKGSAKL